MRLLHKVLLCIYLYRGIADNEKIRHLQFLIEGLSGRASGRPYHKYISFSRAISQIYWL